MTQPTAGRPACTTLGLRPSFGFGDRLGLATPGHERIIQATSFEVSYAGGEANVAVSLAAFGHGAAFVTVLPKNILGDAAVAQLRYYGVDTSPILRTDDGRMGVYFLETGASQRASTVLYDRAKSSLAVTPASAGQKRSQRCWTSATTSPWRSTTTTTAPSWPVMHSCSSGSAPSARS